MNILETMKQARDDANSIQDFANKTDVVIEWAKRISDNLNAAIEEMEKAEPVARLLRYIGKDPYPSGLAKQGHIIAMSYEELPDGMYTDSWEKVAELHAHPAPGEKK